MVYQLTVQNFEDFFTETFSSARGISLMYLETWCPIDLLSWKKNHFVKQPKTLQEVSKMVPCGTLYGRYLCTGQYTVIWVIVGNILGIDMMFQNIPWSYEENSYIGLSKLILRNL